MQILRPFLAFVAAALLPLAGRAAFPTEPDPLDPDPERTPQTVCILYDARVTQGFNLSRSRASSLKRLLENGGLSASVYPAHEFAKALGKPCRVAHLVAITEKGLPPGAAWRLGTFVQGGGHIVAHGCSGPSLEKLLGVAPGSYASPGDGAVWSHFEPDPKEIPHAPERIGNPASGFFSYMPAAPTTRVAAVWRSSGREEPGPAAILRSSAGFWLPRVLYDDGSGTDRARLATALCCVLEPPLWPVVSTNLRASLYAPFGADTVDEAETAAISGAPASAKRALRRAFRDHRAALADAEAAANASPDGFAVVADALWREAAQLELVYAMARPLRSDRVGRPLCVWEKTGYGPFDGDWDKAAAVLEEGGVSDVMIFAGSLAGAVAAVPGLPPTGERARRGGRDPFPDAVRACHARGIRVHAWFPTLQFDLAPKERRTAFERSDRLLHDPNGTSIDWLNPSVEENLADLGAAIAWIVANEGVDGLCLDYLRYPDFETLEPHEPTALEALLRSTRAAVSNAAPACSFRAAVFGSAVSGHEVIGQNWGAWLDAGLLEEAMPMNYVPTMEEFKSLLAAQQRHLDKSVCGIGATSHAALLSGPELLEQLRAAWRAGCAGCAIYPFDNRFAEELLPVLKMAK